MKVPPKRKGNFRSSISAAGERGALNESPSEKEGKSNLASGYVFFRRPSMKVPPKRKGNTCFSTASAAAASALNESPSEKEGKCLDVVEGESQIGGPSMKVPPKRKGNL